MWYLRLYCLIVYGIFTALNRMSIARNNERYNDLAIELAKSVHKHFVYDTHKARPRMYWKMSIDLSRPLVWSEG